MFSASLVWRIAGCAPRARRVAISSERSLELCLRNAERHETDALRLYTVERLAEQQVVLRLREPAEQRPHEHRMVAGSDAELRVPVDDPRRRGRDRDVGEQADSQPGPDGRACHRRHDRLRAGDDVVDEVACLVEDAPPRIRVVRDLDDEVEVSSGAERSAGAAHDHGARLVVVPDRSPNGRELAVHRTTHRVQPALRSQRQAEDTRSGPVELEVRVRGVGLAHAATLECRAPTAERVMLALCRRSSSRRSTAS